MDDLGQTYLKDRLTYRPVPHSIPLPTEPSSWPFKGMSSTGVFPEL